MGRNALGWIGPPHHGGGHHGGGHHGGGGYVSPDFWGWGPNPYANFWNPAMSPELIFDVVDEEDPTKQKRLVGKPVGAFGNDMRFPTWPIAGVVAGAGLLLYWLLKK